MVAGPRQFVVTSTATQQISYNRNRSSLAISNLGSTPFYYGRDASLTTTSGFIIRSGATITFNRGIGDTPELAMFFIADANVSAAIDEHYTKPAED